MKSRFPHRRAVLGGAAFAAACAHGAAPSQSIAWEHKMISAGPNRPNFRVQTPVNTEILTSSHLGRMPPTSADAQAALALLREKAFIQDIDGVVRPTVLVAALEDGVRYFSVRGRVAQAAADLITRNMPRVREAVAPIANFARLPWGRSSFFLLSDVLLDSWQIDAMERDFVGAQRPPRSGGNYYYAVLARAEASDRESFGIYGNQFASDGHTAIGVYGNRRLSALTLANMNVDDLRARFGADGDDAMAMRLLLAQKLIAAEREHAPVSPEEHAGLQALDLMDADRTVAIPILTSDDSDALSAVAELIAPDLANVLNDERPHLRRVYERSPYAEEVTFEEYLIWWYHFFYTETTNQLAAAGALRLPPSGVITYLIG